MNYTNYICKGEMSKILEPIMSEQFQVFEKTCWAYSVALFDGANPAILLCILSFRFPCRIINDLTEV